MCVCVWCFHGAHRYLTLILGRRDCHLILWSYADCAATTFGSAFPYANNNLVIWFYCYFHIFIAYKTGTCTTMSVPVAQYYRCWKRNNRVEFNLWSKLFHLSSSSSYGKGMNLLPPNPTARQTCTLHVRTRKENPEFNPLKTIGQTVFFNLGAASSLRD